MRLAALVALAGCWTGSPPPAPAPAPAREPAKRRVKVREVFPAKSLWIGQYECTQGVTAVQLAIEVVGTRATAVFDFGPLDVNPNLPSGSYRMIGAIVDDPAGTGVTLGPDSWISQPPGYLMVGLEMRADVRHRRMRGAISNPSCTWIDVRRAD